LFRGKLFTTVSDRALADDGLRRQERAKFEIRLDTFNTLNHTQYDGINSTLSVTSLTNPRPTNLASESGNRAGFGAVTSVRPPRNMQISARFQL
jgi:hypothetical protein